MEARRTVIIIGTAAHRREDDESIRASRRQVPPFPEGSPHRALRPITSRPSVHRSSTTPVQHVPTYDRPDNLLASPCCRLRILIYCRCVPSFQSRYTSTCRAPLPPPHDVSPTSRTITTTASTSITTLLRRRRPSTAQCIASPPDSAYIHRPIVPTDAFNACRIPPSHLHPLVPLFARPHVLSDSPADPVVRWAIDGTRCER
ncbi:hypothetical protein PYCCODRAFT_931207 [Trametes coccinea BRFM310]|uniref:Uncharacterized protein n=1 Tax=Trametes coccinea (strain BRFM310) TaxID=1353009 RepID=A0A1Y2IZ38_TRAC3|nr:hypothetical protein PYCCODRAFT_931207 [Trametes coccinea BRFM310]